MKLKCGNECWRTRKGKWNDMKVPIKLLHHAQFDMISLVFPFSHFSFRFLFLFYARLKSALHWFSILLVLLLLLLLSFRIDVKRLVLLPLTLEKFSLLCRCPWPVSYACRLTFMECMNVYARMCIRTNVSFFHWVCVCNCCLSHDPEKNLNRFFMKCNSRVFIAFFLPMAWLIFFWMRRSDNVKGYYMSVGFLYKFCRVILSISLEVNKRQDCSDLQKIKFQ